MIEVKPSPRRAEAPSKLLKCGARPVTPTPPKHPPTASGARAQQPQARPSAIGARAPPVHPLQPPPAHLLGDERMPYKYPHPPCPKWRALAQRADVTLGEKSCPSSKLGTQLCPKASAFKPRVQIPLARWHGSVADPINDASADEPCDSRSSDSEDVCPRDNPYINMYDDEYYNNDASSSAGGGGEAGNDVRAMAKVARLAKMAKVAKLAKMAKVAMLAKMPKPMAWAAM